jgi:hypothetical protein
MVRCTVERIVVVRPQVMNWPSPVGALRSGVSSGGNYAASSPAGAGAGATRVCDASCTVGISSVWVGDSDAGIVSRWGGCGRGECTAR